MIYSLMAVAALGAFSPTTIPYASLKDPANFAAHAKAALEETGIIQVVDVPNYASLRREVLGLSNACASKSEAAQAHTFDDGTTRRTLATHTVPGPGGTQPVITGEEDKKNSAKNSAACASLNRAAGPFREAVAEATRLFGARLSDLLNTPLALSTEAADVSFDSISSVVDEGEHLEHFHSYTKPEPAGEAALTIEPHTDHGLFIAFTPALMLDSSGQAKDTSEGKDSGEFLVELKDGSRVAAEFESGSLVFMLGDGLHTVLKAAAGPSAVALRATPHALVAPNTALGEARAWYGRMVLPPSDAVSPAAEHEGRTFGEIREAMAERALSADGKAEHLGVGCSSPGLVATHRELSTCAAGSTYCWHRCMVIAEYLPDGEAACEALGDGRHMQCVNTRDQLPPTDKHGDCKPWRRLEPSPINPGPAATPDAAQLPPHPALPAPAV